MVYLSLSMQETLDISGRVNEMVIKANKHLEASKVDVRLKIFCINPLPGFTEIADYERMIHDFAFINPSSYYDSSSNATSEFSW